VPFITSNRTLAGITLITFGLLLALRGGFWIPLGLAGAVFGGFEIAKSHKERGSSE